MKKRILAMIVALVIVFTVIPTASAGGGHAIVSESCGENLTWTLTEDGVLTISGTGEMSFDYLPPWYNEAYDVTSIVIEDGVTSIAPDAFSDCSHVTSVIIPDSVTSIGGYAFGWCDELTSLEIPDSVTDIAPDAFSECIGLADEAGFVIVNGILFSYCGSSEKIVIPEGITCIGRSAFGHCDTITEVVIPDGVTVIDDFAFYGCVNLTTINIPNSVASIGSRAFEDTPFQNSIAAEQDMIIINNVLVSYKGTDERVVIPDGVISIADYAFYSCDSITEVTIPDSVTTIGDDAFYGCEGITEVTIPDSVTAIGDGAFTGCAGLADENGFVIVRGRLYGYFGTNENVVIPKGITEIPAGIFRNNDYIKTVTIPSGVTRIGSEAFYNCNNLTSVTMPETVTVIGDFAFADCWNLESVTTLSGVTKIMAYAFSSCESLSDIGTLNSSARLDRCAFVECPNLIDENGFLIVNGVLFECHSTSERVVIPECVKKADWFSFFYSGSTEFVFQGDAPAFDEGCFMLQNGTVYYPAGNPTWTDDLLQDYGADELIWVPYDTFIDVSPEAWYVDEVKWAVDQGITTGMGDGTFAPAATCNRAQVVTFLWRAAGSPKMEGVENPFVDVPAGQFYTDAVLWAVENGITSGADEIHFNPNGACSRAQVVTFLHRAAGSPAPKSSENPFVDVPSGQFYTNAVLWAVEQGITNGIDNNHFAPHDTCNRAQIVTFLYRANAE